MHFIIGIERYTVPMKRYDSQNWVHEPIRDPILYPNTVFVFIAYYITHVI